MDRRDLQLRTKAFALRALKLVKALPRGIGARTIAGQFARSSLSVSANYRAACRARSRPEFISKLGIVLEEADESAHWLELVVEAGMLKEERVQPLLDEANELTAIFTAAVFTTKKDPKSATKANPPAPASRPPTSAL